MKFGSIVLSAVACASALCLSACGGGSDSPAPTANIAAPPPPPATPQATAPPSFTPGVFEASSQFEDRCQVVRTGVDSEGTPFPDMAGSTLQEKFWLRSWTDETYLFPDEVVDRDPNSIAATVAYFDVLRSTEKTASGEDKDDFHFSQPTSEFLERRNSTPVSGYGARFVAFSTTPPRDFRVQYTEPNSPASQSSLGTTNLVRGTRILEIDGIDVVNGGATQAEIDILNNGLFPRTAGESHSFVVRDPGSTQNRSLTLVSQNIAQAPVNRTRILSTPTGDVGYILFNTFSPFSSEKAIADAIASMNAANVQDLVVDLRYNGGGLLAVASQLSYMIAGDAQTSGRTFEQLQFNGKTGNRNPVTGEVNDPVPFFDSGLGFSLVNGEALQSLDLPRVFILSTEDTCSASEAVINSLNGIGVEVILIGDITCGKPFGFYPTGNCGQTYFTIQFQGINDMGFGAYSDGFVPENSSFAFGVRQSGCVVADDYTRELGDPNEALLNAALDFRENGTCPTPPPGAKPDQTASAKTNQDGLSMRDTELTEAEDFILNTRDLTMPF